MSYLREFPGNTGASGGANQTVLCLHCMRDVPAAPECAMCGMPPEDVPHVMPYLEPKTTLDNKYIIGRQLGQGGFAYTYIGRHIHLHKRVAIKEYFPAGLAQGRQRDNRLVVRTDHTSQEGFRNALSEFRAEGQRLIRLCNPEPHLNIVRASDYFEENGTAYLVMDFVDAKSLADLLELELGRGKIFDEQTVLDFMMPVLDALVYVHDMDFLHRDVKPSNILYTEAGRVILIDFGASRQVVGSATHSLDTVLTPGFAPAEQYQRNGRQGPWTEVYSCAATMYCLLTGAPPTSASERVDCANSEDLRPHLMSCRPDLKPVVAETILRGLSMRISERQQTMKEFREQLRGLRGPAQVFVQPAPVVAPDPGPIIVTSPLSEGPAGGGAGGVAGGPGPVGPTPVSMPVSAQGPKDGTGGNSGGGATPSTVSPINPAPATRSPVTPQVRVLLAALVLTLGAAIYFYVQSTAIPAPTPEEAKVLQPKPDAPQVEKKVDTENDPVADKRRVDPPVEQPQMPPAILAEATEAKRVVKEAIEDAFATENTKTYVQAALDSEKQDLRQGEDAFAAGRYAEAIYDFKKLSDRLVALKSEATKFFELSDQIDKICRSIPASWTKTWPEESEAVATKWNAAGRSLSNRLFKEAALGYDATNQALDQLLTKAAMAKKEAEEAKQGADGARSEAESKKDRMPKTWTKATDLYSEGAKQLDERDYVVAKATFASAAKEFQNIVTPPAPTAPAASETSARTSRANAYAARDHAKATALAMSQDYTLLDGYASAKKALDSGEAALSKGDYATAKSKFESAAKAFGGLRPEMIKIGG